MTLKEIVYNIRNIAKNGGITDDERITYEQVRLWVQYYRALLVKREVAKGNSISDNIAQDLGCVEMKMVDCAECCQTTADCTILRTERRLPKPLEFPDKDAIMDVGRIDGTKNYELTSRVEANWSANSRYTSKVSRAFFYNGYIYVTNQPFLKYIKVRGVFEDPTDAKRFTNCNGSSCYTDDSTYPISTWMVQPLTEMILSKELNMAIQTRSDEDNNANGYAGKS